MDLNKYLVPGRLGIILLPLFAKISESYIWVTCNPLRAAKIFSVYGICLRYIHFICLWQTNLQLGLYRIVLSSLTHREFMQLSDHNNVELQYFSMEPLPLVFVRGEILRVWGGTRTLRRVLGAPVVALLEGSLRSPDRASDRAAVVVAPPQIRMTMFCILLGNA